MLMLLLGTVDPRDLLRMHHRFPTAVKRGLHGPHSPSQQPCTPRCHLLSSQTKQLRMRRASSSKSPLTAQTKSQSYSGDISAKTSLGPGKGTNGESPITHGSPLKLPV